MQTRESPRILVLGHSFVWRLAQFAAESSLPCVATNFRLSMAPTVQFYGIGGRTITKLRQFDLPVVAQFNPTVIILDIGSNDICNPHHNVKDLATNIFHLVQTFHFLYHVQHIFVGQIMPRKSPPVMSPPYNTRVSYLNDCLHHSLKNAPFATFWFHPTILRSKTSVFLPDGVHLNSTGNHLLYHSYQKALLRYFSRVMRDNSNARVSIFYRPPCRPRRRRKRARLAVTH